MRNINGQRQKERTNSSINVTWSPVRRAQVMQHIPLSEPLEPELDPREKTALAFPFRQRARRRATQVAESPEVERQLR